MAILHKKVAIFFCKIKDDESTTYIGEPHHVELNAVGQGKKVYKSLKIK